MSMFQYDPNISLGTIIETVMLLGVVITCYTTLVGKDIQHDERIASNAAVVESLKQATTNDLKDIKENTRQIQSSLQSIQLEQTRVRVQLDSLPAKPGR